MEKGNKQIDIRSVGICSGCKVVLIAKAGISWILGAKCPRCRNYLSLKDFGFENDGGGWRKVCWVSEDKRWTDKEPKENFVLGEWLILVGIVDTVGSIEIIN